MSYVYLISESDEGPVKVGVAGNPYARIRELQTGNPKRLRLVHTWALFDRPGAFTVERLVLEEMSEYRLSGEWIDADEFGMKAVVSRHVEDVLFS
jgi:hypothetical protein